MNRVIVTGASGFIGRHLVQHLINIGRKPVSVKRAEALEFFSELQGDAFKDATIFHLAGFAYPEKSFDQPHDTFVSNVGLSEQILEFCKHYSAKIIVPTTACYKDRSISVLSKESDELVWDNPYSFSKLLVEELCALYHRLYRVDTIVLRLFNVYGPGQGSQFLVPWLMSQLEQGSTVRVKDVQSSRDFVFVTDVVRAFLSAEANAKGGECYNIGTGYSVGIRELIDGIGTVWGLKDIEVVSDERNLRLGVTRADISKAEDHFGWRPKKDLLEGLAELRKTHPRLRG
jgi:nucleoside-diphosphate-sugar epimerase